MTPLQTSDINYQESLLITLILICLLICLG